MSTSMEEVSISEYPEHQKLKVIAAESQKLGAFIEWMRGLGVEFCKFRDDDDQSPPIEDGSHWIDTVINIAERSQPWTHHEFYAMPIDKILARYFEIDLNIIEQEKRHMLAEMRKK